MPASPSPLRLGPVLVAILLLAGCSALPAPTTTGAIETTTAATAFAGRGSADADGAILADKPKVIEKPTLADLAVTGNLPDRSLGRPEAPLTVIEYASLTCPYCRAFHQETFAKVKKAYIDTGKVRWVLREFPIGHTSGHAWIVNRCAPEKDYFKLFELFLSQQSAWVSQEVRPDAIYAIAKQAGMSRADFDACLTNQALEKDLSWVKQRGRQLGVSGTPTFFIGDNRQRGFFTFEEFSAFIEAGLGAKTASATP